MRLRHNSLISAALLIALLASATSNRSRLRQATPPPDPTWQISTKTTHDESKAYTISDAFPVLQASGTTADGFNKAVADFIKTGDDAFKKDMTDTGTPDPAAALPGSEMAVTYDIFVTHSGLISVRFTIYSYLSGAAHPLTGFGTLNYDLQSGKVLTLADLFKPNAKYLDVIARYTQQTLKAENRLSFPEGAKATADNYAKWSFDRGGLLFSFDDYQVGPYVEGPSEVLVPYTLLADLVVEGLDFR